MINLKKSFFNFGIYMLAGISIISFANIKSNWRYLFELIVLIIIFKAYPFPVKEVENEERT
jgi:hypothetical protein